VPSDVVVRMERAVRRPVESASVDQAGSASTATRVSSTHLLNKQTFMHSLRRRKSR